MNQKQEKKPTDPVTKKNMKAATNAYPKYRTLLAVSEISNSV